jgi:hypothetical protein
MIELARSMREELTQLLADARKSLRRDECGPTVVGPFTISTDQVRMRWARRSVHGRLTWVPTWEKRTPTGHWLRRGFNALVNDLERT